MRQNDWLTERFETHRTHLRGVAYRMLGSLSEADDAVQEAWLRVSRADAEAVQNLGGWFTTIVARVCLNMLRSRAARREEALEGRLPDPIVDRADGVDPENEVLLADSIGLALQVVLDTLTPSERLAFVLHDVFGLPFQQIAVILDRSPAAARQLASRGRRRVQGAPVPDANLATQREVVSAFLTAAREGDFDALLAVLAPDVVVRSDGGAARPELTAVVRGAEMVAGQALTFSRLAPAARPVLVNGAPGLLIAPEGRLFVLMAFVVSGHRIAAIDILADPTRLQALGLKDLLA